MAGPVALLKVKAGVHEYDVAPEAVNPDVSPGQIEIGLAETNVFGICVTLTVVDPAPIHPKAEVPNTVYPFVLGGFAVTLAPVFVFKKMLGVQV